MYGLRYRNNTKSIITAGNYIYSSRMPLVNYLFIEIL